MDKVLGIYEDLKNSTNCFFNPNKERVEKMLSLLQRMEGSLDAYLDKPLDDNNVHFACGDALENVIGGLKDLINAMDYYKHEIDAKAKSWEAYPHKFTDDGEDLNESVRRGFVDGYIYAKRYNK